MRFAEDRMDSGGGYPRSLLDRTRARAEARAPADVAEAGWKPAFLSGSRWGSPASCRHCGLLTFAGICHDALCRRCITGAPEDQLRAPLEMLIADIRASRSRTVGRRI